MAAFDFANKKGFKTFMARLYGWGASIVILGALFKINHWNGATWMLLIGMATEAVIFFFSAFEKPFVEVNWSAVYPELAPQYEEGGEVSEAAVPKGSRHELQQRRPIDDLNQLFKEAGVDANMIKEFGDGLKKFSTNAQQMIDVSAATIANDGFVGNIKKASANLETLNTVYETQLKTISEMKPLNSQALQSAMDELSSKLHTSITDFSNKLHTSIEGFSGQVQSSAEQVNNYQKQMQTLTTSISALNNIYGNMLSAMTNINRS